MEYIETAGNVRAERGMVRVSTTAYGSDGMTIVETGKSYALTPAAAKVVALRILQAVADIEEAAQDVSNADPCPNVTRLRA